MGKVTVDISGWEEERYEKLEFYADHFETQDIVFPDETTVVFVTDAPESLTDYLVENGAINPHIDDYSMEQ